MKKGIELIAEERQRQVDVEGFTPKHDACHVNGELAMAACCYAAPRPLFAMMKFGKTLSFYDPWPFESESVRGSFDWDKRKEFNKSNVPINPEQLTIPQRIDLLIKAGALIAAEIDRIQNIE